MRNGIIRVIDFFYPLFRRLMPLQTFRYAACGGFNVLLGFVIFTVLFHLLAPYGVVRLAAGAFEPYSVSLFLSSATVFCVGFLLNKYVVFTASNLRGRIQLFRYFLSFISNLAINYVLLKFLIVYLGLYPVLAQVIVTAILVVLSYFTQQYFTFRVKEGEEGVRNGE